MNKDLIYKLESIYAKDGITKVYERDIAKAMGMSPEQFSENKNSGKIPYKYLVSYCMQNNVNINWILDSSRKLENQKKSTEYIVQWQKCRMNLLDRVRGKFDGKCGPAKDFGTTSSRVVVNDQENLEWVKPIEEKITVFDPKYKEPVYGKFSKILIIIFWAGIVFSVGYILGTKSTENKVYVDKIQKLESKHKELKQKILDGIKKEDKPFIN